MVEHINEKDWYKQAEEVFQRRKRLNRPWLEHEKVPRGFKKSVDFDVVTDPEEKLIFDEFTKRALEDDGK